MAEPVDPEFDVIRQLELLVERIELSCTPQSWGELTSALKVAREQDYGCLMACVAREVTLPSDANRAELQQSYAAMQVDDSVFSGARLFARRQSRGEGVREVSPDLKRENIVEAYRTGRFLEVFVAQAKVMLSIERGLSNPESQTREKGVEFASKMDEQLSVVSESLQGVVGVARKEGVSISARDVAEHLSDALNNPAGKRVVRRIDAAFQSALTQPSMRF